jgi:hypothetical protein
VKVDEIPKTQFKFELCFWKIQCQSPCRAG